MQNAATTHDGPTDFWRRALTSHRDDEPATDRTNPANHAAHVAEWAVPTRFGDYRLQRLIAAGGIAEVYYAHRNDELPCALKITRTEQRTREARARHLEHFGRPMLEWEYQVLQRASHANVIRAFDRGIVDDVDYLAMELFEAPTLDDLIKQGERERLPQEFSRIVEQCAEALGAVHAAGLIHCDVKPHNFLRDEGGLIKLIDFGSAIPIDDPENFHPRRWITASGGYISPEQRHKRPLDERTDIYSFGVMLHVLLSGEFPYAERRRMTSREQNELPVVPMVRRLNGDVSPQLEALLARMLSNDPGERPRDLSVFLDEFRAIRPFDA